MNDQILELSNEELEVVAGGSAPATLTDFETAAAKLQQVSFASELDNNALGSHQITATNAVNADSTANKFLNITLPG